LVLRRQLKRRYVLAFFEKLPPCLVGIEACASSHHWSHELQALGHTVRLMPPAYVKPYVKRQKNDMADAEAICEAVTRANMRFVPTKTGWVRDPLYVLFSWSPGIVADRRRRATPGMLVVKSSNNCALTNKSAAAVSSFIICQKWSNVCDI
jgi:hypothetical protein